MKEFHLQIVTPDGIMYDGMAESLLVRTDTGDVEILANHTNLFASLGIGRARIKTAEGDKLGACAGGFLSVSEGKVQLVATTFEVKEKINLERAHRAKAKAEEMLRNARSDMEIELAKAKLKRALIRIKVGGEK